MTAFPEKGVAGGGARGERRHLLERSRANFGRTRAIVRARLARRRTNAMPAAWPRPLGVWLFALLFAALLLDPPVGAFFGKWNHGLAQAAEYSTRLALGTTYILPACLVLVWANLTDWSAWRGRRLLALYNRTILAGFLLLTVASSGLLANALKYGIGRGRPAFFADHGAYHLEPFAMTSVLAGFPSGHATTTGAVATLLLLLFPKWRYAIAPAALWLAWTRVVLNAHYPSDVIAGLGLGAAVTLVIARLFARAGYLFDVDGTGRLKARKTALILR
jgi:undecaprenyl-diphosphatase